MRALNAWFLSLLLLLLLATSAAAGEFDHGLLWKIERHGKVSWLFGTMHNDDRRVTRLPPPVDEAFDAATSVVLEINPDNGVTAGLKAMSFGEGRDLERIAGYALYRRTADAMLARGIPREVTRTLKPWAVALMLSMPRVSSGDFLDLMLYRRALNANLPFHPLESAEEQLSMFDDLPMPDQLTLLRDTLEMLPELPAMIDEMTRLYVAGDLAGLMAINERQRGSDPELADRLDKLMITDRNRRMTARMIRRLRAGGAFVAVGAAHLYGDQGIPSLLKKRGYRVTKLH